MRAPRESQRAPREPQGSPREAKQPCSAHLCAHIHTDTHALPHTPTLCHANPHTHTHTHTHTETGVTMSIPTPSPSPAIRPREPFPLFWAPWLSPWPFPGPPGSQSHCFPPWSSLCSLEILQTSLRRALHTVVPHLHNCTHKADVCTLIACHNLI